MAQLNRSDINTAFGSGDIYVADNFYDATWWGYAQCSQRTNNLLRCDLWTVSFNERTLPADDYWWRKVGCHEFGHTGGLGHRTSADDTDTNSCMREGRVSVQQLDSHDLNQINSRV
ncbi:hypothetical protein ACOCJ7_11745 [Knoellia sp. CPCC 206453]|uniref:hypothetical protein n=1 Tax=Knoellia pratensis TaxID=3404796 RepID=UPI0036066E32